MRPGDAGLGWLVRVLAAVSVVFLAALAVAPLGPYFAEWRRAQQRYNALAGANGARPIPVALQQIWKPELGITDRCISCHLGMGESAPVAGDPLFRAHPTIPHDALEFGCTSCHGGQGRATTREAAHGFVSHWDQQMLPREHVEAGCGTCHSGIPVPRAALAEKGGKLVRDGGCGDCHRAGGAGPDLGYAGLRGFAGGWHDQHVEKSAAAGSGPWTTSFAPLAEDEVAAIGEYLRTRVGAPRLLEGKMIAHRLGCRGCHRIDGVGGDDGPDLSDEGHRVAADLDFAGVRGPHTLAGWLREHFLAPARVVPGSQMPDLGIGEREADALTVYMLSLRTRPIPEVLAPRDRVRALRLGERDFPTDGESLYGVFCAACHGPRGEGRRFPALARAMPAVGNPDFLAVADDRFLRRAILAGRPDRRMPAWGTKEGGLRREEVDALVGHLRALEPPAPSFEEVTAAPSDPEAGKAVFARDCAPCHGAAGAGTVLAPPLAASDNPATKDDSRLYGTLTVGMAGTAMGSFRRYDAATLRSVIAAARSLPPSGALRTGWAPGAGDPRRGEALYARHCAECHGPRGAGGEAPALGSPAFLATAGDPYLVATIIRGRGGTTMRAFGQPDARSPPLEPQAVADVVAFLRSLSR